MSAIGSSESKLQSLTDPSAAQEARLGSSGSRLPSVAFGFHTIEPTGVVWPRNGRIYNKMYWSKQE